MKVCTFQILIKKSLTPRWPLTPLLLRSHVWLYPRIILSKSHENMSKYVDTVPFFPQLEPKVIDPWMTFDLKSVKVTCVTLPKDHFVQVPWKYIKVCGYSDPFFKNLNQRSLTPRWPLTPHLLKSLCDSTQGSLCPSPMGIHQCMWIQWSILQNTTYYRHTTNILHTHSTYYIQNEWSHSLFLNKVQARQKWSLCYTWSYLLI